MQVASYDDQLNELLSLSLDKCLESVSAGSGSIFLLDAEKKELVLKIAKNINNISLGGVRKRLGEGITGIVALKKRPLLVENINKDPLFPHKSCFSHYQSNSFLSIPLNFSGNLLGVVNITDKISGVPFNDKDLLALVNICRYLGIAIYSLQNYLKRQKRLNEALRAEVAELKKAVKHSQKFSSLGKLVGGFVHEINNPLDGVIRYINLSLDCLEEDGLAREYLLETKEGLNRIARFVRSLLDFCWSLSSQEREININRVIEESLFLFKHYLTPYNIALEKKLSPSLPKIVDCGLKIVFSNIIKNASEAMRETGGKLTVATSRKNGMVKVVFSDTGGGIPKNIEERIFEPFFTTKGMGEGSGLGLAIVKEIIQRNKGRISLRNREGKGVVFTILLPPAKQK